MTLTIILICCLPAGLILLVIFAIGTAGARTYRVGKRAYLDFKPYLNDLSQKADRAQQMTTNFAERGASLSKNFEEIGGRWAFIADSITETRNSPAVRIADMAGRFAGKHS
ncbi:MAG: hypothetical protein ACYC99_07650 [Candidatus Geothermincolia bacterium]